MFLVVPGVYRLKHGNGNIEHPPFTMMFLSIGISGYPFAIEQWLFFPEGCKMCWTWHHVASRRGARGNVILVKNIPLGLESRENWGCGVCGSLWALDFHIFTPHFYESIWPTLRRSLTIWCWRLWVFYKNMRFLHFSSSFSSHPHENCTIFGKLPWFDGLRQSPRRVHDQCMGEDIRDAFQSATGTVTSCKMGPVLRICQENSPIPSHAPDFFFFGGAHGAHGGKQTYTDLYRSSSYFVVYRPRCGFILWWVCNMWSKEHPPRWLSQKSPAPTQYWIVCAVPRMYLENPDTYTHISVYNIYICIYIYNIPDISYTHVYAYAAYVYVRGISCMRMKQTWSSSLPLDHCIARLPTCIFSCLLNPFLSRQWWHGTDILWKARRRGASNIRATNMIQAGFNLSHWKRSDTP